MCRNILLALSLLAVFCVSGSAATTINVGNHLLLPNAPHQFVDIFVHGGDPIQGVNFRAQIGDDPFSLTSPVFEQANTTIIDTGMVFGTNNQGLTGDSAWQFPLPTLVDLDTLAAGQQNTPMGYVVAEGWLARLMVDTTGLFAPQSWSLIVAAPIHGTTNWAGSLYPAVLGGGPVPNPVIFDGSLTIVPEPSSLVLAALGLISLGVYAWRRKR